ncbi:energy transducer TonB [Vitiosangium sp. GDMCC 1.1324]|uniref:energy transducer TonB n=1 Tax=Vitiosangium sp. (strain GDMCC 1.1324) TaxID=2138576 RepID=UPI00130EB5ED|nr:energy transducer TonB [Vitiosangium sp. GDMCC 1.1324]
MPLALGASVVLHVLGAAVLWRGASEPEHVRKAGGPLEVELVWRDASGPSGTEGTGQKAPEVPAPARPPERIRRPAPASRSHEKAPPRAGGEVAGTSLVERAEPEPDVRQAALPSDESQTPEPAPVAGGLPEATVGAAPRGAGEGVPGSGSEETSRVGAPGGGMAPGPGLPGGGTPGVDVGSELRAYRERLSRHVTRQRRYPAQAVRLGMEGTALVRVRINRDGSLAGPPRLEGSSRFGVLDAEALRMVEAAAPFSPLPAELPRESAEFVIPVSFSLRAASG